MALVIDSEMAANAGAGVTNASSLTYSFTNTAGTYIVVGVSWGDGAAFTITSVTYAGVNMGAAIVSVGYDGAGHNQSGAALYGLLSPATGPNNVIVTLSAGTSGAQRGIESGAISFTGQDPVTPIVAGSGKTNFRESNGATATVTSGTTTVGNIALAQMATGTGYTSTSQTLSWSKNQNTSSAGGNGAMTRAAGTGGAIAFSDVISSDFMGMVCAEVAAATGLVGYSAPWYRA